MKSTPSVIEAGVIWQICVFFEGESRLYLESNVVELHVTGKHFAI